jgi:hypothetical protein
VILAPPPRRLDPIDLLTRELRAAKFDPALGTASVDAPLLCPGGAPELGRARAAAATAGADAPLPCPPPKEVLDRLLPLYQLLPVCLVLDVLQATRRHSRRQRDLPAHCVVWLVVAASLFRDRSLPMVWRHLHSSRDGAGPDDSAFTHARKRLGAQPLRQLFHRVAAPLGQPGMSSAFHNGLRVLALDGSVIEVPDTPANRAHFGSSSNQHKEAAFPQLQALALCEVGTHAILDFEFGPYKVSELALSEELLRRLPEGVLLLMDRGLSYYEQVRLALDRGSHVLARVKAEQRELPVEEALPDGSYLSHIYPSFNDRRANKGGIQVRVIRYTHDDPGRGGTGEESCLITTLLDPAQLSAQQAVGLYPWRWEEESALEEMKEVLLGGNMPLLRSKTPELVEQELYGLLLAHFLVRSVMAAAAVLAEVEPSRLSFKRSQEVLEDYLMEKPGRPGKRAWLRRMVVEVSRQQLRPKEHRSNPRVKKVTRCKWPSKKEQDKGRVHQRPFAEVCRIVSPAAAAAGQTKEPAPVGHATG